MFLERLSEFGGVADAYQQYAGGEGIESTRVADFQVLLAEVALCRILDLADHVSRSPSVWLVDRYDNASRIVFYAIREAFQFFICNQRVH